VTQENFLFLLLMHYNSGRVLAFSTMTFYLGRSWTCSVHLTICTRLMSFLISSSHRDFGLPAGLPLSGFHLYIFFTTLVSGILFMCRKIFYIDLIFKHCPANRKRRLSALPNLGPYTYDIKASDFPRSSIYT
jgi:hypothetical protein